MPVLLSVSGISRSLVVFLAYGGLLELMGTPILLTEVWVFPPSLKMARRDCVEGRLSKTEGPISVAPTPDQRGYYIWDGYHRFVVGVREFQVEEPDSPYATETDMSVLELLELN